MIGYLEGTVLLHDIKRSIVVANGVGYTVFPSANAFATMKKGEMCRIFIYTSVKEDALDLFGFATVEEQMFFEQLISVSGVGPRSALGILGLAPVSDLQNAIASGDAAYLTKVSGIGKKTGEKIMVELRDKIARNLETQEIYSSSHNDVIDALTALGYSLADIRSVINKIEGTTTQERVKHALKLFNS